ncbi:MAG: hypothetical protein Fur0020_04320 [Thermodesulfovibrionia bacterium]
MRYINNDIGSFYSSEDVVSSVLRFCDLIRGYPQILKPIRGMDDEVERVSSENGFKLYPTVKKTTLLNNGNFFFKILHPITIKDRLRFLLTNRAEGIFKLSEVLRKHGISIVEVVAYGTLRIGRKPLYVMNKVTGRSLYDALIKDRETVGFNVLEAVIDEVARMHKLGYWFGDAHLSHIFIDESGVTGLIDIDGIRRNDSFNIKRMARDIAGLNHTSIPITSDEKVQLLGRYMDRLGIKERDWFLRLIKIYIKKRWG